MKAWLGWSSSRESKQRTRLYVFDPAIHDELLLRVWEHDPEATETEDHKVIMLSVRDVATLGKINGVVFTVNGIRRPTSEEIEADTMRTRKPAPQPCRAIVPYKPPVAAKPLVATPNVIYLPAPFVATVWCETMAA